MSILWSHIPTIATVSHASGDDIKMMLVFVEACICMHLSACVHISTFAYLCKDTHTCLNIHLFQGEGTLKQTAMPGARAGGDLPVEAGLARAGSQCGPATPAWAMVPFWRVFKQSFLCVLYIYIHRNM